MSCSKINNIRYISSPRKHYYSNSISHYCFTSSIPFRSTKWPILCSYTNSSKQESVAKVAQSQRLYSVKFESLEGCKLGISRYPDFDYNAKGGLGTGSVIRDDNDDLFVSFDVEKLSIPSLNSSTTKFLGLPLPPFLSIDIVPQIFQGTINKDSGQVIYISTPRVCSTYLESII